MLGVIAGFDEMDPTTIDMPVPDYTAALKMRVSKLRLGLPRADFFENFNPEYGNAVEGAIDVLRKLTASVTQVNLSGKYQAATRALMIRSDDVKPEAYAEARRQVDLVGREIKTVFQTMDLLMTPTMKAPPVTGAASLSFAQHRSVAGLAGLGSVALLLAAIGLYGVNAYAVARRTNEI